jgi:hypothetical protein
MSGLTGGAVRTAASQDRHAAFAMQALNVAACTNTNFVYFAKILGLM